MFSRKKSKRPKEKADAGKSSEEAESTFADGKQSAAPEEEVEAPAAGGADQRSMPPLYRQPTPLSREAHGAWHLTRERDYRFAESTPLIPLNVAEFEIASRHFPIVFSAQGNMALAVLGTSGDNALVGQDGAWRQGAYVPAYVRRYPFMFIKAPEDKFILSIDTAHDGFGETGEPLFDDGEPSTLTKNALAFCQVFERELGATGRFIQAVSDAHILSQDQPNFSRSSGRKLTVKGVRIIDQAVLDNLPDDTVGVWRREGWLPAIYAHLSSLSNWELIGA